MPAPLASWNPARDAWEMSHSHIDLFSEQPAVWSETWPSWGMWADGVAYELPTLAPPTDASASSSSPGLVPTPLSSDAGPRGGTTGFGLRDWSRNLLPTPTASDTNGAGAHGTGGPDLRTVAAMLPTPTSRDWKGANQRGDDSCLTGALLPTPTAVPYGNNQSPSPGAAVRPSLDSLAPMLLPTPRASDGPDASSHGRTWSKTDRSLHTLVHLGELPLTGDSTDQPSDDGNAA